MKTGMVLLLALASLAAVGKPLNYDESKVPPYTLEDPLAFADAALDDLNQTGAQ